MKKSGFIVIICFLCLFLSSYGKKSETGISLYYINEARTGFVEKKITCKSKTQEAIVKELYDKLRKLSADGTSKAASDYMVINDVALEGGILYLNFASGYTGLSDKDKALFRTAVSKTMSSLDFVEYVRIYENGSPITDSNGIDIGLLNNQSFITDSNSDDEIDTTEAVIYYSDSVGSSLVGEKKTITYDKNTPVEKVILKHIIDGPSGNGNKRTVPSNLRILSVYTKKGTCYVNFDSSFLNSLADVSADVTIYSIVDTLCGLSGIQRVQIMVDGSSDWNFRESYSLSEPYERNLDLVKKEK